MENTQPGRGGFQLFPAASKTQADILNKNKTLWEEYGINCVVTAGS